MFPQLSLRIVNLYLKPVYLYFILFTCVDPDLHLEYGSGSRKLLNTDPYLHFILYLHVWIQIRIRIPNTDPDPESFWIRIHISIFSYTVFTYVDPDPDPYLEYGSIPPFFPILYLHMWIRIRIWNTDPDPESFWIRIQYGSRFTTLVTTRFFSVKI